jgi:hypothetical protein
MSAGPGAGVPSDRHPVRSAVKSREIASARHHENASDSKAGRPALTVIRDRV